MRAYEFTTTVKAGRPTKLGLFSDIHCDNPNFDKSTFEEHANYCLKDGRYMLFDGDIFDAIIRTDKKRAVNSLLESGDNQLNMKLDKAYELLKPYQEQILFMGRGNHCLIEDTEVLTADGFKPIKDIMLDDFVASYDVDNDTIVYDNPLQIHHVPYDGEMFLQESQGLNFGVSPDHRMFGISNNGKSYYRLAKDFSKGSVYRAKVSVESKSIGINLSNDEIRLLGWLLTDAYIPKKGGAIIYQSKEQYVEKIRGLLDRMRIEYKETIRKRYIESICGKKLKSQKPEHQFRLHIDFVRKIQDLAKSGKWFGVIRNASQEQFGVFFETITDADGNRPRLSKSCCALHGKKEILEKFQILCFLHGIRASLSVSTRGHYVLNCTRTTTAELNRWGESVKKIKNPFDKIYCLTMPQSNFVVRRCGRIMITGNCESILKYSGIDVLDLLAKMLNSGKKHQIVVGNYANFIRFSWLNTHNKSVLKYDIYAHHGAGGSAPQTKGMLDFAALEKGANVDLIWIGHKHNSLIDYSAPIMFIDQNGNIILKNRQCVQTPSYQKGRTIDYNVNFAERFYSHTALSGFGELTLTPQSDKEKYYLNADLKITTKPQAVLGEVISSKLTQRKR